MVPIHLSLTDSPFVPHNLIEIRKSVPLPQYHMAPPWLKISIFSGSKKGTQIYFTLISKRPGKQILPGSPLGPLYRKVTAYRTFSHIYWYIFISRALIKQHPSVFPKSGAPMETTDHSGALLNISFAVPSKEALPTEPLEREKFHS
jgi:hypothetical protein